MYHYIMLDLTYNDKPVCLTVHEDFASAVDQVEYMQNHDNEYLRNIYIESYTTEQFEE